MGSPGFSERPHNSSRLAEPLGVRINSSYTVLGEDLWIEIFRDHGWSGAVNLFFPGRNSLTLTYSAKAYRNQVSFPRTVVVKWK